MADNRKRKLRLTTLLYWVLLIYIIAALLWWLFSLYDQNESMYHLQRQLLDPNSPDYGSTLADIEDERWRDKIKYIGEGITFLVLILFGAVYLYRSVRRQFRAQQQQQNFVMAITHELKTPLSVARLNLETLQRHNLDEGRKTKLVQMTLQETLRLDSLINNILISSQLEGHSYHISKEELNFSDLVADVTQQFLNRYSERKLVQDIEKDIDLNGDPLLLKLLVSNLLENANKYSGRSTPVFVKLFRTGKKISLEIKDEGEGISREEKKNVFKKFYRIGNEQNRKTKGTGLGLFLCKKIAEDHDGTVSIGDNQPKGSIFTVNFSV